MIFLIFHVLHIFIWKFTSYYMQHFILLITGNSFLLHVTLLFILFLYKKLVINASSRPVNQYSYIRAVQKMKRSKIYLKRRFPSVSRYIMSWMNCFTPQKRMTNCVVQSNHWRRLKQRSCCDHRDGRRLVFAVVRLSVCSCHRWTVLCHRRE